MYGILGAAGYRKLADHQTDRLASRSDYELDLSIFWIKCSEFRI